MLFVQIARGTEDSEEKPVRKPEVSTEAPSSKDETQATESSLRSKRFRLVRSKKKRGTGGFSFLIAREMKRKPKNEREGRGRGGKEGRNA